MGTQPHHNSNSSWAKLQMKLEMNNYIPLFYVDIIDYVIIVKGRHTQ